MGMLTARVAPGLRYGAHRLEEQVHFVSLQQKGGQVGRTPGAKARAPQETPESRRGGSCCDGDSCQGLRGRWSGAWRGVGSRKGLQPQESEDFLQEPAKGKRKEPCPVVVHTGAAQTGGLEVQSQRLPP